MVTREEILGKSAEIDARLVLVTKAVVDARAPEGTVFERMTKSVTSAVSALIPGGSDV
jgi:hypothetical protein